MKKYLVSIDFPVVCDDTYSFEDLMCVIAKHWANRSDLSLVDELTQLTTRAVVTETRPLQPADRDRRKS